MYRSVCDKKCAVFVKKFPRTLQNIIIGFCHLLMQILDEIVTFTTSCVYLNVIVLFKKKPEGHYIEIPNLILSILKLKKFNRKIRYLHVQ